jgi:hypothetical protein
MSCTEIRRGLSSFDGIAHEMQGQVERSDLRKEARALSIFRLRQDFLPYQRRTRDGSHHFMAGSFCLLDCVTSLIRSIPRSTRICIPCYG